MRILMLFSLFSLFSCTTVDRKKVEADAWQFKMLPPEICAQMSQNKIKNAGFFRKIACHSKGQHQLCNGGAAYYYEVVSPCNKRAERMIGMDRDDVNKWLSKLTTPGASK